MWLALVWAKIICVTLGLSTSAPTQGRDVPCYWFWRSGSPLKLCGEISPASLTCDLIASELPVFEEQHECKTSFILPCFLWSQLAMFLLEKSHLSAWLLLKWLVKSIFHVHTNLLIQWWESHSLSSLFQTPLLTFCNTDRLGALQNYKILINNCFLNSRLSCVFL